MEPFLTILHVATLRAPSSGCLQIDQSGSVATFYNFLLDDSYLNDWIGNICRLNVLNDLNTIAEGSCKSNGK